MPYEERRVNVNTPVKSLPIEPGTIMEMLTLDNKMIFVGSVEWFKETTVQIIDSSGGYIPPQEYNTNASIPSDFHHSTENRFAYSVRMRCSL